MRKLYDAFRVFLNACKNIWRDRRRSGFTLAVVAFACFIVLVVSGYLEFMISSMYTLSQNWEHGHLQIASPEFFNREGTTTDGIDTEDLERLETFLENAEEVDYYNARRKEPVLLHSSLGALAANAFFGRPEAEMLMLIPFISEGEILSFYPAPEIILGEDTAEILGVARGDTLRLSLSGRDDTLELQVDVHSLYGNAMFDDARNVYLNLDFLELSGGDSRPNYLQIVLKDIEDVPAVKARLEALIQDGGLEVRDYHQLSEFYQDIGKMFAAGLNLFVGVLIFVLFFNINNSVNMILVDRRKEFATLRALGTSRGKIVRNIVLEILLLGILGAAVGCLGGLVAEKLISFGGFSLPPAPGQSDPTPVTLLIEGKMLAEIFGLFAGFCGIAAVFPAVRASRRSIPRALQNR